MSVKRIKAFRLENGHVGVTMEMSLHAWAVLATVAAHGGYFSASDYLAALVNMQVENDCAELGLWPAEAEQQGDEADPFGDGIPF